MAHLPVLPLPLTGAGWPDDGWPPGCETAWCFYMRYHLLNIWLRYLSTNMQKSCLVLPIVKTKTVQRFSLKTITTYQIGLRFNYNNCIIEQTLFLFISKSEQFSTSHFDLRTKKMLPGGGPLKMPHKFKFLWFLIYLFLGCEEDQDRRLMTQMWKGKYLGAVSQNVCPWVWVWDCFVFSQASEWKGAHIVHRQIKY